MKRKAINWNELEERAKNMSFDKIRYALKDIQDTLQHADDMDRVTGSDNGGKYRDEASIYWRELRRRGEM